MWLKFIKNCISNALDDGRTGPFGGYLSWGLVVSVAAGGRLDGGKEVHTAVTKAWKKIKKYIHIIFKTY